MIKNQKINALLISVSLLLIACGSVTEPNDPCADMVLGGTSNDVYRGERMFDRCDRPSVSPTKRDFVIGESIELETTFHPLFTGIGVMWLVVHGNIEMSDPRLVQDSEIPYAYFADVSLTADEAYTARWKATVIGKHGGSVSLFISFRLVAVGDTNTLYPVRSEEVREAYGFLDTRAEYARCVLPEARE